MPISFKIEENLLYTTISGHATIEELMSYVSMVEGHPHYHSDMDGIFDLRELSSLPTITDLHQAAELVKSRPRTGRVAKRAVLVSKEIVFLVIRMFQMFARRGPIEFRVFRDEREAREWLSQGTPHSRRPS